MHLNKLVTTKKDDTVYVIAFNQEEFEDLRSALSIASKEAKRLHPDSPVFCKALKKMDKNLQKLALDAFNRIRQKAATQKDAGVKR